MTSDCGQFFRAIGELEAQFRQREVVVPQSAASRADGFDASPAWDSQRRSRELPVCVWLDAALASAPAPLLSVCGALAAIAARLCWQQNDGYAGADFLGGYGYCELAGPRGHVREYDRSLGLLLLAPNIEYPAHWHPATETYLILSGAAHWQIGDGAPVPRQAGSIVRHASGVAHAMRTGTEPLLAAYYWEDHLDQPARMVRVASRSADRSYEGEDER